MIFDILRKKAKTSRKMSRSRPIRVSSRSRLGLKFKRLGLVSVSEKCGKVLVSSRTKKQMSRSRLGLGPEGLVYNPAFTGIYEFLLLKEKK